LLPILLAATLALSEWQPLDRALEEAQSQHKLVLLYVEAGIPEKDARAALWIDEAAQHQAVQQSFDDMILARMEYASPLLRTYEEVRVIAKRRAPHMIILDPAGGVVTEAEAFGKVPVSALASTLLALRAQEKAFVSSGRYRLDGKIGAAYFMRGVGLAKAGLGKPARTAFEFAGAAAKRTDDAVLMQRADLGIASIDLAWGLHYSSGLSALKKIAANPLSPDIGANAWLLIGNARKDRKDPNGAIAAYTAAYRLMPPESPIADSARRSLEMMGAAVPETEAMEHGKVRLIFSRQPIIAGDLEVAVVAPESTTRVEYFIDGARVTDASRSPFRAKLSLGSAPRVHELKAVARNRANAIVGEDAVTINDHPERLSAQIVSPRDEQIATAATVEIAVRAPDGVQVEGVDIFWNDRKLATLTSAPYRYELTLPKRDDFGYVRVVAHDSTGAVAEDAKLINGASVAEEMQVDAVDLYAIVQDRKGHIIEGLTASDFKVKEDGVPVAVTLRSAANDPITVGLALDTSGSMRPIMMDVAEYAAAFLRDSLTKGDRTLVTTFDSEPHLAQTLTDDLQHVSTSLAGAVSGGGTAIWDSIAFTLRQLRSATGKRSLVVFTDGMDNGSSTTPEGVLAVARETGVVVYVVLMFDDAAADRMMMGPRYAAIEMIARDTGGAVFRSPRKNDLPVLFARVRDDTRGEYILSFVSKSTKPKADLRKLSVEVPGRSVTVRAMTGYYPR
jgi:Ca-activated chloride channel family protein